MDSVRRIGRSTPAGSNGYREPAGNHEEPESAPASRALVVVAQASPRAVEGGHCNRPDAPFLAQLIATKQDLPQTRERRRAEPSDAIAAYMAAKRAA